MSWRDEAACRGGDPDVFFVDPSDPAFEARRVCRSCSVTVECLDYAVSTHQPYGIWAGTSPKTRQTIRSRSETDY